MRLCAVGTAADETRVGLARSDGKYLFSGNSGAKESRTIEAASTVLAAAGQRPRHQNLNGKPSAPVGPKGQVRTVQFTSGGFENCTVAKPAAPLDPL